jgi:hypothetical protein
MRKRILLGLILMATLLVGATACTPEQMQALEALQGNITIQLKDGTITSFNFKDVPASTLRQALGGALLERGDGVTIKRDRDGRIREVESRKAAIEGEITAKGADNVTIRNDNGRVVTLKVTTANTTITIEDKGKATFAELAVGQHVEAIFDVSTMIALKIEVQADDDEDVRPGLLEGIIQSIASDNKSIVVTGLLKGDVTLNISANTTIFVSGKGTNSVAGLKVGQRVKASYAMPGFKAIRIMVVADGQIKDNRGQQQRQDKDTGWNNRKGDDNNRDRGD